jgi:hypothetical protein
MSTRRKLPRPTYLYQPDGIVDVADYKGYDFRIELHNCWSQTPTFEFATSPHSQKISLYSVLSGKQHHEYLDAVAVWRSRISRNEDPDPEMPHAAIFKVLDAIVVFKNEEREKERAEWAAKHPKANSVLEQLRQKASAKQAVQS